jgi:hypothetical protein
VEKMKDKTRKVMDINDLKKLAYKSLEPFFIALNCELVSSKEIRWSGRKYFYVTHCIDGTIEKLTTEELEESYAGKALKAGCLYWEDDLDPAYFM